MELYLTALCFEGLILLLLYDCIDEGLVLDNNVEKITDTNNMRREKKSLRLLLRSAENILIF